MRILAHQSGARPEAEAVLVVDGRIVDGDRDLAIGQVVQREPAQRRMGPALGVLVDDDRVEHLLASSSTGVQPSPGSKLSIARRRRQGVVAEVGLVDRARLAHHEAHHPGVAIVRREGDQRVAGDHVPADHVVERPARRVRRPAWSGCLIIVAEIGLGLDVLPVDAVAVGRRPRHEVADRALRRAGLVGPVEPVARPGVADDRAREGPQPVAVRILAR